MAPAVVSAAENENTPSVTHKHYNISLVINLKRGKDEIEFAAKETDRLHGLIGADKEVDWAKNQITVIHRMIFMPDAEQIKNDITTKIEEADDAPRKR